MTLILLQSGGAGILNLTPIILMIGVMYFLLIMPQRKRQRAIQAMLENLKVNDKIVTTGGIYGTITAVRDDKKTLQIKIADNPAVRVEIARTAVAGLQGSEEVNKQT
ncbi:MAG TPA: preprotein translocase subunit YajC [Blastocatellia bacterium]|nr:preprotein translocase subunit YajC [Blastocatellia bacterium]